MNDESIDAAMREAERAVRGEAEYVTFELPLVPGEPFMFDPYDGEEPHGEPKRILAAIRAHLELGPAARDGARPHVWAYYEDIQAQCDGQALEDRAPPAGEAEIWDHVSAGSMSVDAPDDGPVSLIVTANCTWDPEHALMMVWRDGTELVKVSG